jgi:hypothetical protein
MEYIKKIISDDEIYATFTTEGVYFETPISSSDNPDEILVKINASVTQHNTVMNSMGYV